MVTRLSLLEEYPETIQRTESGQVVTVCYATRVNPLSGDSAKLSEERAKRRIGITVKLDVTPTEQCDFCDYEKKTPEDRIQHDCGAVSVSNRYPWEKYDYVTIYPPFGQHKLLLSDLYFDDIKMMVESSYDLAERISTDSEVIAFMDFTNWGAFAGASQQHPHSQRKSVTALLDSVESIELARCKSVYDSTGTNLFDLLREEEMRRDNRIIYYNDIVILAAFAPESNNELLIFPREPISHILQTSKAERKLITNPILGIFPALFFYLGVTDLNIASHMAPFREMENARSYYRWHMHVYPRRSSLPSDKAGAEVGYRTSVIDVPPETTARLVGSWYKEGPKRELVARQTDGGLNGRLLELFDQLCVK